MNLIAIDPGSAGGIAWRKNDGPVTYFDALKMPETEGDVVALLRRIGMVNTNVVMEEVGGFIKGNPAPGSAMFNFGRGFGFILGVLSAYDVRVELVRPQKWLKTLSLGTRAKTEDKTEWKNKLKARAQQLYPQCTVTLSTSDALLLLEYGRKTGL